QALRGQREHAHARSAVRALLLFASARLRAHRRARGRGVIERGRSPQAAPPPSPASRAPIARVVGVHGRHGVIELPGGHRLLAHARGKKSEIVVGDRVRWQPAGDEAVIEGIEPRDSLLKRQDEWRTKNFAANVQLLLVMVAVDPPYSESQL